MFENLFAQRGLSLDRLRSFLEVVEAGSIVRAASQDPVRQSQYSRQIGELEAFFGTELFRRRGRALHLTEAGHSLARVGREQLLGLIDFQTQCQGMPQTFNIGAGDSLLQWVILPVMARFQARFPRSRLVLSNMRSSEIAKGLADLRLDFGLARASVIRAPLRQVSVGDVRYALYIPQKMLAGKSRWDERRMAAELPWVTLGSDGEFMGQVEEAARQHRLEINFRLITESFPQAARAVRTGDYAAILPVHARKDFRDQEVRVIEPDFLKRTGRKVVLAWNPRMIRIRAGAEQAAGLLRELIRF